MNTNKQIEETKRLIALYQDGLISYHELSTNSHCRVYRGYGKKVYIEE